VTRKPTGMMGGEVTVTSKPGKGSVFTVRLPTGPPLLTRSAGELFRIRNDAPNSGDQRLELDWFDIEPVAARGNGLLALAVQRMRGHANDRDVAGLRILLETAHGLPAVKERHFEVDQDYVRALGQCQLAALLAVLRSENFEIVDPLKAHLEHIEVVVVVFDIEHFGHDQPLFNQLFIRSPSRG